MTGRSKLKLVFVGGPRAGQTLEYIPGRSVYRLGRIARGNNIVVKDPGVSDKHLYIYPDSDQWIIQDRRSVNGTRLNSEALGPYIPVNLRHGDVIKLGESTSILVNLEKKAVADPDPDPVEQPARKGSRAATSNEEEEEVVPVEKTGNSRARGGKKKSEDSGLKPSRATRSKKKDIDGDSFLDLEMVLKNARKSRTKKKMEARNEDLKDDETRVEQEEPRTYEWFDFMAAQTRRQISEETEKEIDFMAAQMRRQISEETEKEIESLRAFDEWFDFKAAQLRREMFEETEMEIEALRASDERFDFKAAQLRREIFQETEKEIEALREKAWKVHIE